MGAKGQRQDPVEVSCQELFEAAQEYQVRELSFWVCANMVANALGRCEFRTFRGHQEIQEKEYYLWNISPNVNQNSSAFLHKLVARLYQNNEALIVNTLARPDMDALVVADSWTEPEDWPSRQKEYRDIMVTNKFEEPIDGEWTLSVLMKIDSLPAGSYIAIQIANDTKQAYPGYSINSEAAQMEKYAIYTLTANISGWEASDVMRVSVYNYGGPAAFAVKSVKLEPGAKQTHARLDGAGVWKRLPQPDEDYAVQLAKCQRYYQLYSSAAVRPNSPIDCRPVMRTPTGGRLTQGTIVIDGVTYYYNSAEL